jgi:type I restriction enzyme S subunit
MNNCIPASSYCLKIFDGTHDTPKPVKYGFPLVTSKNILQNKLNLNDCYNISEIDYISIQKRSKVTKWDVLFSMIGSVGEIYIEKSDSIPYAIKNIGVFSCQDEYKAKWLYYYFKSPQSNKFIQNYLNGAVQKFLPLGTLRNFPVIPFNKINIPLIDLLFSLDSKIELNNQINIELEAMAKTLYDYWFVQFDFPDSNSKPYKTNGGKMEWSNDLKREIPLGWKSKKIADWIQADKSGDWGNDVPTGNYVNKVNCIRGTDINGLNGLEECKPPVRYILEKNSHKILNSHDLIIEISGGSPTQSTGRLGYITDASLKRFDNPLICSNFCKAISLKDKKLLYNFVYYWDSLYKNGVLFGHEGKTSGIKNLLFDSFVNSFWTVVPNDDVAEKFYGIMQNIQEKKQAALSENQTLSELRDWLLPMLMNGQVKVQ